MKIYSITDARKKLGELVKQVKYAKTIIALGQHGKPEAFLIASDLTEMNAASESFDFLREEPELYSPADLKKRYV